VNSISVRLETKDANLRKQFEAIMGSVEGFVVLATDTAGRADLLIFELGDAPDKEFQMVNAQLNSDEVGEVFYVGTQSDPAVLLRAIQSGAREFFIQPINEEEIRGALERLQKRWKPRAEEEEEPEPGKVGQIIHVVGSKGGTGTTTVAVNLAVSLIEDKSAPSVALVDMNLIFGEIPLFLGIQPSYHWGEITKNITRLDATFLQTFLSCDSSGLCVLSSPARLDRKLPATPEVIERLLKVMRTMFDFVIVDGGQSLDSNALKILQMADTVFVISILSIPCLSNTNKLLKSFDDLGFPPRERVKVVINRYLKDSDISIEDAETAIEDKIFQSIVNDYRATISAINKGQPLIRLSPRASITKDFKDLTNTLLQADAHSPPVVENEQKQERKWWKLSK
jgi:pilus assembly protein CpaE